MTLIVNVDILREDAKNGGEAGRNNNKYLVWGNVKIADIIWSNNVKEDDVIWGNDVKITDILRSNNVKSR